MLINLAKIKYLINPLGLPVANYTQAGIVGADGFQYPQPATDPPTHLVAVPTSPTQAGNN